MQISEKLYKEALRYIPAGVNSPVRSFKYVDGTPIFIKSARGSKLITEDGSELSDYIMSWGAIILGHSSEVVNRAIVSALKNGTSFGLCHKMEIEFAKIFSNIFPDFLFRMVNSGTEATMSAVRVARGFTKRKHIIKFSGCYHGHSDQFLTSSGSGLATLSIPASNGVPEEFTLCTITLEYNSDIEILKNTFKKYEIAAVILEVLPGNMGIVPPKKEFINSLISLCRANSTLIIYDEVITGFRTGWGGIAGERKVEFITFESGIKKWESFEISIPDMITFGKVVGGGLPIGVFGGRREIMEKVAPSGDVYQAGTLAGNPISLSAGLAVLNFISETKNFYHILKEKTIALSDLLIEEFLKKGIPVSIVSGTGMLSLFFSEKVPQNFSDVKASDKKLFNRFFKVLLENGVIIPPSPYEAWFISLQHKEEDFEKIRKAIKKL